MIESFPYNGSITSIYFDKHNNLLGAELYNTKVRIINLRTNKSNSSFNHNNWVIVASVSPSGNFLITGSGNNKARLFDMKKQKEIKILELNSSVSALSFAPSENFLAIASHDNKVQLFNSKTYEKIIAFNHNKLVPSVFISSSGNMCATASSDEKARIFTRYDEYTVDQLQLKHALLTWLLTEKPNKAINSIEQLLADIAKKHILIRPSHLNDEQELVVIGKVWNTFPTNMQAALWRTMLYRIATHGK